MKLVATAILALLLLTACSDKPNAGPQAAATAPPVSAPRAVDPAAAGRPSVASRSVGRYDPTSFSLSLEPVVAGLSKPVYVTAPPDGSGRLFIVEQGGTIRIAVNGQMQRDPFLNISANVPRLGNYDERGLLGMAFHPRYAENGRFFIMFTAANGDNTVARYSVSRTNPNQADPASAVTLFAVPDPASNHNGGMLAFGPDGYLYIGTGDGGGAGDRYRNGQNLSTLLGKILRLDVDGGDPYAIPANNPLVGRADARPEIWAYGLRNPWRFSFDRATGDLYIADVGQDAMEEINLQRAGSRGGENYGWPRMEGTRCYPSGSQCDRAGLVEPISEYDHRAGSSITGGYVYRGGAYPEMNGGYFFADWGSGRVWSLHEGTGGWQQTELLKTDAAVSSFGEDEAGELYLADLKTNTIYRLTATPR